MRSMLPPEEEAELPDIDDHIVMPGYQLEDGIVIFRVDEPELPDIDDHIVRPQTRYEIEDGRLVYVPPADPPHGEAHAQLAAVVEAHRGDAFKVAVDLLTRTSRIDDIAPDVSVYPKALDPKTGGRQLDHLAFEIASTERLGHAGKRAAKLMSRGVRRVFVIAVEREQVLEWSVKLAAWSILDRTSSIEDPALAVPLPVAAMLDAVKAEAAIPQAYRAQRHPEFLAERAEGRAEGLAEARAAAVLTVLEARGLTPTADERDRIRAERDPDRVARWLAAAVTCASVAALFDA